MRFLLLVVFVVGLALGNQFGSQASWGPRVIHYTMESPSQETSQQFLAEVESQFDLWKVHHQESAFDVMVNRVEQRALKALAENYGVSLEIDHYVHENLLGDISQNLEMNQIAKQGANATFFDAYRTYDEIVEFISSLSVEYPEFVEVFHIGLTYESREIYALSITADRTADKPKIFYNACQHAREWISPMTVTYVAYYLVANYTAEHPEIRQLLDNFEVIIVPVTNVDGYLYTWEQDSNRLWRKNRHPSVPCTGVDNNRNWAYEWGLSGSSGDKCSETYRGTEGFSEPENSALANYISQYKDQVVAYIDFHSYGYDFVWPWGYTCSQVPPENSQMQALGKAFTSAVYDVHGSNFTIGNSCNAIYQTSGAAPDWVYGDAGVIYSYTCELRGNSFILPPDQIVLSGEEIFAGVLAMSEYLLSNAQQVVEISVNQ